MVRCSGCSVFVAESNGMAELHFLSGDARFDDRFLELWIESLLVFLTVPLPLYPLFPTWR